MENCQPKGWQFPMLPPSCSQYLLYYTECLIKYIVYISFGFKTIQVKWIFEFVFRTSKIQTLIRHHAVRIYGEHYAHKFWADNTFLKITCCQAYHLLPSSIVCKGVVSWFNGWYWFLSNDSQLIRINYFTWKYHICTYITQDQEQMGLKIYATEIQYKRNTGTAFYKMKDIN